MGQTPSQAVFDDKRLSGLRNKAQSFQAAGLQECKRDCQKPIDKSQTEGFTKYKRVFRWCLKTNRFKAFTEKHFHELNINYLKRLKFDLKNISIMLNENLFDIQKCNNGEFDEFVRIFLPVFKEGKKRAKTICLPIKYHKHSLKFKDWNRKKSIQL